MTRILLLAYTGWSGAHHSYEMMGFAIIVILWLAWGQWEMSED